MNQIERRDQRPAAGIVRIQAITMLPATPQRTADSRRVAPTPMTDELITCVVDTGRPSARSRASPRWRRSARRSRSPG